MICTKRKTQLSVCATHTCWLRSWKVSSGSRGLPYLVEVDLGLGVRCWDCGGRVATRGGSSQCGESPEKNSAEHGAAAVPPLTLRTKPCACRSSRRSHVSPEPLSNPAAGARSWIHSLLTEINQSLRSPVWRQRHHKKRVRLCTHVTWSDRSFTAKGEFSEEQTRRKKVFLSSSATSREASRFLVSGRDVFSREIQTRRRVQGWDKTLRQPTAISAKTWLHHSNILKIFSFFYKK